MYIYDTYEAYYSGKNISGSMKVGVWGRSPQQALQSARGRFMNEVSESCHRHVVKACPSIIRE